jgi:Na+/H+-translocating membrane pyrophosphatase
MTDFDPRQHRAYAVSVVVVSVLLLLAMLATLFAVLFVMHAIASTL